MSGTSGPVSFPGTASKTKGHFHTDQPRLRGTWGEWCSESLPQKPDPKEGVL